MKVLITILLVFSFNVFGAEVDLNKSSFKWTGSKVSGKHFGKVTLNSATLEEKDGHIKSGVFVMNMTSITCEDLQGEWMDKLISHLKNDDFFAVDKHPTSTLKIKHGMNGTISADLTIKGVSQPIEVKYTKDGSRYKGTMKFDRTKFGIKYGSGSFFENLGDRMIYDEVTVDFIVVLK